MVCVFQCYVLLCISYVAFLGLYKNDIGILRMVCTNKASEELIQLALSTDSDRVKVFFSF